MTDFIKFWEVFQVFPRYTLWQKIAIIAGLPLCFYIMYLLTAGRPPLVAYALTIRAGQVMTATGPLNADGNIMVFWSLGNDTKPNAELHNIKGEFWTDKKYLVKQSPPAWREATFADKTTIFYDLQVPLLHKNDGGIFLKWEFKPPPIGEEITLTYNAVASEVEWQWGTWSITNDGKKVELAHRWSNKGTP
jgi:hypothetical protein